MYYYLILIFSVILFFFYIYIKIKYKFWLKQPVFQYYNIYYWIYPNGIIEKNIPKINIKFYDLNLKFSKISELNNKDKMLVHCLINQNYLKNRKIKYNPSFKDIFEYFNNTNSYISLKYSITGGLIGCITSKNLLCFKDNIKRNINYVDFLCVRKSERKKGIAEKLIYTHYIKTRKINICPVSLFKREGKQNLIVPLVKYKAYGYDIKFKNILYDNNFKTNNLKYILINTSNIKSLYHYLNIIKNKFKFFIMPDMNNIYNQIKNNILIIGLVLRNNIPICIYLFRNAKTYYNNKSSIECFGSYYSLNERYFINGFSNIIKLINNKFDIILIENISYNDIIINKILKKENILWKVNMGYYFYNYVAHTINNNNILIIT